MAVEITNVCGWRVTQDADGFKICDDQGKHRGSFRDVPALVMHFAMVFQAADHRIHLLKEIVELYKRTDQDDPEIEKPLSAADFVDEVAEVLERI